MCRDQEQDREAKELTLQTGTRPALRDLLTRVFMSILDQPTPEKTNTEGPDRRDACYNIYMYC